uniref:Lysosomal membrane ascorbate-dependent ferrireductase CYB561A3 n=1 Tax=Sinocyclocheilus rhinocerous TaxID=307959 RepID=A0A673J2H7_9TELE
MRFPVSFYVLSVWLGFLCVMFVCLWSGIWRGGFAWDGSFLQFNWHPVLMVTSLVVLYGNAIVLYRVPLKWSRWWCKLTHGGLLFVAVVLSVLGVRAPFDFHTGSPQWPYSLCSIFIDSCLWFVGLCAFLLPWTPLAVRACLKLLHIWMGIAIFTLSLITSLSGINEKLLNTEPYTALPAEALFANSLGILVVIFGLLVLKILSNQKWKNPEFENETDRVTCALPLSYIPFRCN